MKKLKEIVTSEERENVKEKILEAMLTELKDSEITVIFAITLLKEVISELEDKALNKAFRTL